MTDLENDPFFRIYALGVGHVLTAQDVADIQKVLADYNEEIGERADEQHRIRLETLREVGGDELVAASEAADDALVRKCTAKALKRFDEVRVAHEADIAMMEQKHDL